MNDCRRRARRVERHSSELQEMRSIAVTVRAIPGVVFYYLGKLVDSEYVEGGSATAL